MPFILLSQFYTRKQHGYHQILVCTVDTDVVVLAVMVAETLPAKHELWVAFGSGATNQIEARLGSENVCSFSVSCTSWM